MKSRTSIRFCQFPGAKPRQGSVPVLAAGVVAIKEVAETESFMVSVPLEV